MLRRSRRLLEVSQRDTEVNNDQDGRPNSEDGPDHMERQISGDQTVDRPSKRRKRTSMAELVRVEVAKAISDINAGQNKTTPVLPRADDRQPEHTQDWATVNNSNAANFHLPTITQSTANSPVVAPLNSLEQSVQAILAPDQGRISSSVNDITNFDLPLGSNLSDRVRSKIIAGEYIDLSSLLNPFFNDEIVGLNIGLNGQQGSSSPFIKVNNRPRSIESIHTWTSAMLIYASVYLPHHTSEIGPLHQYIEFIRKMANHGHGWRFYDEAFRRAKSTQSLKWNVPLINQYIAA